MGITEYYFDHEGFSGTIKERFSDFHVHEITLDGQIAKLDNQELPPELKDLENLEKIHGNIPESVQKQFQLLTQEDDSISSIQIDVTDMNKEERRAIHVMAKTILNVVSQTESIEGKKMITVTKVKRRTGTICELGHLLIQYYTYTTKTELIYLSSQNEKNYILLYF